MNDPTERPLASLPSLRQPALPAQVSSTDSTPSKAVAASRLSVRDRRVLYFLSEGRTKSWIAKKYGITPAAVDAIASSPAAAAFVDLQFGQTDLRSMLLHKKAMKRLEEQLDVGGARPTLDELKLRDRAIAKVLEIRERYRPKGGSSEGGGVYRNLHQTYVAAGGQVVQQAD